MLCFPVCPPPLISLYRMENRTTCSGNRYALTLYPSPTRALTLLRTLFTDRLQKHLHPNRLLNVKIDVFNPLFFLQIFPVDSRHEDNDSLRMCLFDC